MRLLNTETLELEEFLGRVWVRYAILSHRWREEEILFEDMKDFNACCKKGKSKIISACQLAVTEGYDYIWIDTCCIDKTSSAELSEAINSMFEWYQGSGVCYAYLYDVDVGRPEAREDRSELVHSRLRDSVWFSRCWTLQELIAPPQLSFYDQSWKYLGSRRGSSTVIHGRTGIPNDVLTASYTPNLARYCVAERMSWAAKRSATRVEDIAYSLLGLFKINMPLLYGEGENAFRRLQEAIIKEHNDLTILAFDDSGLRWLNYMGGQQGLIDIKHEYYNLLAYHPIQFSNYNGERHQNYDLTSVRLDLNREGIELETQIAKISDNVYAAAIGRTGDNHRTPPIMILLGYDTLTQTYLRLPSPTKLMDDSDCIANNLGIWVPPGVMNSLKLPKKKLLLSKKVGRRFQDREPPINLLSYSFDVTNFDICSWGELPYLGRTTLLLALLSTLRQKHGEIELAAGSRFDPKNRRIVHFDVPKPGTFVPVCNVFFKANARGLHLGHLAAGTNERGEVSPICIVIDLFYEKNNCDGGSKRGRPTYRQIKTMTIDYENLQPHKICPPMISSSLQWMSTVMNSFLQGNNIQSSWIYFGLPANPANECDHFFMHKIFRPARTRQQVALSMGRVEIRTVSERVSNPQWKRHDDDNPSRTRYGFNICWKLMIEEMTDSFDIDKQWKLQKEPFPHAYDVFKWSFAAFLAFRMLEWVLTRLLSWLKHNL